MKHNVTQSWPDTSGSESLLRAVLETVNCVFAIDSEGIILTVNPAITPIFNYSPQELIGQSIKILLSDSCIHELEACLKKFLATSKDDAIGLANLKLTGRRKDKTNFPLELSVNEIKVDGNSMFTGVLRNINDSKEIAKEFEHFKYVLDKTQDMIFMFDADSLQFVYLNDGALNSMGYSHAEFLQLKPFDIKPLIQEQEFHALITPLLSGEQEVLHFETVLRRKNGKEFPVEIFLQLVREVGEHGRFVAIVRDITQRKRIESEIQMREQRIQALFDTIVDGIVVIDSKGIIETFNPAAEKLFGYRDEEVRGKNVNMLMPQPYAREHDGYLHNFEGTGERKIIGIGRQVVGLRKDRSTFPMDLAVGEMHIDGKTMFTGIVRDISERRAAEQSLTEKNHEIETTASYDRTQSRIMALFSASYNTVEIIQKVLKLLSDKHNFPILAFYQFDEWKGLLHCVAGHGLPKGGDQSLKLGQGLVGQVAVDGKLMMLTAPQEMPFNIDTGLFSITPSAVVASPIIYSEKVLGVMVLASLTELNDNELGFIERITKQMGVSLNAINQYHDLKELSEQLKNSSREISKKNTQLEQANRLKTEFLANMSHELRTPLNAIIGFSEVLKDDLLGAMNAEQTDYVGEIFVSANHLLSLINDILDLSKIEAGKMELFLDQINVSELLSNAMTIIKEKAHNHNISLQLKVNDDVNLIQCDGRKIKQVVFNLLSNAVKFTPDGGEVILSAKRIKNDLEVSIIDTGIGIAKHDLSLLFRPFEQLDGSLSRQYEGTGLGLVMVKRLVELHGGQVTVSSEEGQGSCFKFIIPYRESVTNVLKGKRYNSDIFSDGSNAIDAESAKTSSSTIAAPLFVDSQSRPKILLVEDNDQSADLMVVNLINSGYQVQRASTGNEGLTIAESQKPDLVIMDILLPDIDGWEVMKRMKSDPVMASIPVLVVSIVADVHKGFNLGAVNVLEKPVRKQTLLDAVGKVISVTEAVSEIQVLVVDDDIKAVQFITTQLQAEGFQALSAYGGQEGIDIACRKIPDLIILDLMMPEVNGFDVVSTVRQNAATRDIPVIILTAKILTEEDRIELNKHVTEIISKSEFNMQKFLDNVRHTLPGKRSAFKSNDGRVTEAPLVMVVEDNKDHADLLKLYMEDIGLQVIQAANGRVALEQMKHLRPNLITLALVMPEMDGFDFMKAKSKHPEYSDIPVMILTDKDDTYRLKGNALAGEVVLNKPIRRKELLPLIKKLLLNPQYTGEQRDKVLLIDDDPEAIKVLSSCLANTEYEIIEAFGGADGIEMAKTKIPDIIVLDQVMPETDGFEVLSALKVNENTHNIPVLLLTAKILSEKENRLLEPAVVAIAEKGKVNQGFLAGEVKRILREHSKQ